MQARLRRLRNSGGGDCSETVDSARAKLGRAGATGNETKRSVRAELWNDLQYFNTEWRDQFPRTRTTAAAFWQQDARPAVLAGLAENWSARQWTLERLSAQFGEQRFSNALNSTAQQQRLSR